MTADPRDVLLAVPAKPAYLVLARLTLAAVCRLAPLEASEVAELKLAVTEAAGDFVCDGHEVDPHEHPAAGSEAERVEFSFRLEADRLVCELSGTAPRSEVPERELSRAIIEATADHVEFSPDRTVLIKRL